MFEEARPHSFLNLWLIQWSINIIYESYLFFSRKAVSKTSALHNLAVYVAQDCTGEINTLRYLLNYITFLLVRVNFRGISMFMALLHFHVHHGNISLEEIFLSLLSSDFLLTTSLLSSVQRGCGSSVWSVTEPGASWSVQPSLEVCHHTGACATGRGGPQPIVHRMCQGRYNLLHASHPSISVFLT